MTLKIVNRMLIKIKVKQNKKSSLVLHLVYDQKINVVLVQPKKMNKNIKKPMSVQWKSIHNQNNRNKYIVFVEPPTNRIWSAAIYARNGIISTVLVLSKTRSLIMIANLTTANTVKNVLISRRRINQRKVNPRNLMKRNLKLIGSSQNRLRLIRN